MTSLEVRHEPDDGGRRWTVMAGQRRCADDGGQRRMAADVPSMCHDRAGSSGVRKR